LPGTDRKISTTEQLQPVVGGVCSSRCTGRQPHCRRTERAVASHYEGEWSILHRAPRRAGRCLHERQPERLPPLAATVGGRGGCQRARRGAFLRASLTAYNPKGDTLRTERSMLQCGLAISITALTVLGMAITAVAAPYTPKSGQCYSACEAKCAARHSCERSNASQDCFTHYNECKAACRRSCSK